MFDNVPLPAAALITGAVLAGGSYVAGQAFVGERMIAKSGAIRVCQSELLDERSEKREQAMSALGTTPVDPVKPIRAVGSLLGEFIFGTRPGGREYLDHYARDFEKLGDAIGKVTEMLPEVQAAKRAKEELAEKKTLILKRLSPDPKTAATCECRARGAIVENGKDLAWTIATFTLIPAPDWAAAMRAPSVIAKCGR